MSSATILVVDDESNIRRMLCRLLEAEGYRAFEAADGAAAIAAVEAESPDVVLIDLAMPRMDGMAALEVLRDRWPDVPVVMMSGRATLADAVRATKLGAFHFIEKPLSPEAVLLTVHGACELRRARELTRVLVAELGAETDLVGSSAPLSHIREQIRRIAPTDARVLLSGESGTGKELVAAGLHGLSPRAGQPFIRVNSAAIPRELIESEMFGHERGAFTGAIDRRRGRFELADGGTLFLDEVGELSSEAQSKLLRAIESGEIQRLGGDAPIRVDVRVVAATNRDLEKEVAAGRFRRDLYYRLNVVPIHLPPLRERVSDIPALTAHFMKRLQARHGLTPAELDNDALQRLMTYAWPGNVRELANICERLAILHRGGTVTAADLASVLPASAAEPAACRSSLADQLDDYERSLIVDALNTAAGNVAEAARLLETDRPNLYRRMKRLGIEK